MKITNVSAIILKLPSISTAADGTQDDLIIKVETDEGHYRLWRSGYLPVCR